MENPNTIHNLTQQSRLLINELIQDGYNFMLLYELDSHSQGIEPPFWEVDFVKKKPSGGWDNHIEGVSKDINKAVKQAYDNIKQGRRLNQ